MVLILIGNVEKMDPELLLQAMRGVVVLQGLWDDRRNLVESALDRAEILRYSYRPEAWPPSFVLARRNQSLELYLQGTSNKWQAWPHLHGAVATTLERGSVHSGMRWAGIDLYRTLADDLPKDSTVTIYGHSYGGGAGQVLAEWMVRNGHPPEKVRVVAMGSPKTFTKDVGTPLYRCDLVMVKRDPVPLMPPDDLPVFYWDANTGFVPLIDHNDAWTFRGKQHWLTADGKVSDNHDGTYNAPWTNQGFLGTHFFLSYRQHLNRVAVVRDYKMPASYNHLLEISRSIEDEANNLRIIPENSWYSEGPPDPLGNRLFFVSSDSKGSYPAMNATKCIVNLKVGSYGFSETHYHTASGDSPPSLEMVEKELLVYLKNRVKILEPRVVYPTHIYVESYRITRESGNRESIVKYDPEILDIKDNPVKPDTEAGVEYPWTAMMCDLTAGEKIRRKFLLRPVWDTVYMNFIGFRASNDVMRKKAQDLGQLYMAQNCWAIKAQDRTSFPAVNIVRATPAPAPVGGTYLYVSGGSFAASQTIRVEGGKPEHKPLRGEHLIFDVPEPNVLHLLPQLISDRLPGGAKVRRVEYSYFRVQTFKPVRMVSRDTGNGIGLGRGRR